MAAAGKRERLVGPTMEVLEYDSNSTRTKRRCVRTTSPRIVTMKQLVDGSTVGPAWAQLLDAVTLECDGWRWRMKIKDRGAIVKVNSRRMRMKKCLSLHDNDVISVGCLDNVVEYRFRRNFRCDGPAIVANNAQSSECPPTGERDLRFPVQTSEDAEQASTALRLVESRPMRIVITETDTEICSLMLQKLRTERKLRRAEQEKETIQAKLLAAEATVQKMRRAIETELSCPVCQEVIIDANALSCGHLICSFCIREWAWGKICPTCPSCRQVIPMETKKCPAVGNVIEAVYTALGQESVVARRVLVEERQRQDEEASADRAAQRQVEVERRARGTQPAHIIGVQPQGRVITEAGNGGEVDLIELVRRREDVITNLRALLDTYAGRRANRNAEAQRNIEIID